MPTKQEIEQIYKIEHDRITKGFYQEHALSKADFQAQHEALGQKFLTDLEAIGEWQHPPDPTDWVAKYGLCKNDAERIGLIAQRLGMVPQI